MDHALSGAQPGSEVDDVRDVDPPEGDSILAELDPPSR
jgi:hypothetical protein